MVNILKFEHISFFALNNILVIRVGIHKMLVRTTNREDSDQTASSDLCLRCLSMSFFTGKYWNMVW